MKLKKQERRAQKKSKGTSGRKKLNSRTSNARDGTRDEYGFW